MGSVTRAGSVVRIAEKLQKTTQDKKDLDPSSGLNKGEQHKKGKMVHRSGSDLISQSASLNFRAQSMRNAC